MRSKTIEIRNLSIGYSIKKNTCIVAQDINADIYSGELTCLLGANGIGKSTLLRTLSAFLPKLSGYISILGKDLDRYRDSELATLVSVVLTDRVDIKNMTCRELIGLGRSPYTGFWGSLSKTDIDIIDQAISMVGIDNLANRMVHTLSDGERQKVMITKALVQQTPIILLDEPTAFLDFPSKVEIMQLLHQLSRKTNKTIFLSTHDVELALQIADKIWLMDRDKAIETGTPEDLSIKGALNRFFARKGIVFDQETGLFRVKHQQERRLKLAGDGFVYKMIQKALSRHGIVVSQDEGCETFVRIVDQEIRLYAEGNEYVKISDIEELLNLLV